MVFKKAINIGHKPKSMKNKSMGFFTRLKSAVKYNHLPDTNIKFMLLPFSRWLEGLPRSCVRKYDQVHRNVKLIY